MTSVNCPSCNEPLEDSGKFCDNCGYKLPDAIIQRVSSVLPNEGAVRRANETRPMVDSGIFPQPDSEYDSRPLENTGPIKIDPAIFNTTQPVKPKPKMSFTKKLLIGVIGIPFLLFVILVFIGAVKSMLGPEDPAVPAQKVTPQENPAEVKTEPSSQEPNGSQTVPATSQPAALFAIVDNGLMGFMDQTGKEVVKPIFEDALNFSGPYGPFKTGGLWGYVDAAGNVMVAPAFEEAYPVKGDMARVKVNGKYGFMHLNDIASGGTTLAIPAQYEDARDFSDELAAVKSEGKWGYLDKTGKYFYGPTYVAAGDFAEGLAPVTSDGTSWGYIDKNHTVPIYRADFANALEFSQGLAPVLVGNKVIYIDKTGNQAITGEFENGYSFTEGLASVTQGGKAGYINKDGQFVIPLQYDEAAPFMNGLAAVSLGGKWSYIDQTGKVIWSQK